MADESGQYPMARRSTNPQKKRDELAPLPVAQTRRRSAPFTEDDFLAEDDPLASKPPRPGSSAIRLNNPGGTGIQRAVSTQTNRQIAPLQPQRRTGPQTITTSASIPARARTTTQQAPVYSPPAPQPRKESHKVHWLLPIGVGMLAMLALWVVGSSVLAWGTARYNDIRYGNPRTTQTDAVVGHGGDSTLHPSHFIAINLNRHIIVYEIMAGDPTKTITYGGPYLYGTGEDLTPPIVEFRDVTGDGRLDMIIHIGDQSVVFVNAGDKFRPSTPSDNIHL